MDTQLATSRRGRVQCDRNCGAFLEPNANNPAEMVAALEHWRHHDVLGGCSHGQ